MEKLIQQINELEKHAVMVDTAFAIVKWVAGLLFVYIVGCGYYIYKWTKKFKKDNEQRANIFFEHTGQEREQLAEQIRIIDDSNQENSSLLGVLAGDIRGEKELREQAIKDCKERCYEIRCKK